MNEDEAGVVLAALKTEWPAVRFAYDVSVDCILAERSTGVLFLDTAGRHETPTLKWCASFGEHETLDRTPVRAVRLLCQRAGLQLGSL